MCRLQELCVCLDLWQFCFVCNWIKFYIFMKQIKSLNSWLSKIEKVTLWRRLIHLSVILSYKLNLVNELYLIFGGMQTKTKVADMNSTRKAVVDSPMRRTSNADTIWSHNYLVFVQHIPTLWIVNHISKFKPEDK